MLKNFSNKTHPIEQIISTLLLIRYNIWFGGCTFPLNSKKEMLPTKGRGGVAKGPMLLN